MAKKSQSEYVTAYMKENVVVKKVLFSRNSPEEMALLEWAQSHDNFSGYIKNLIREEMEEIQSKIADLHENK